MVNKVIGYVKDKKTSIILPYVDKDENGYKVISLSGTYDWQTLSYFEEVDVIEEKQTNDVIKSVHNLIDRQQEKGLKKYGTLVNKEDYSLLGWIEHAQQEAADLLIYLEVIKAKVKDVIG